MSIVLISRDSIDLWKHEYIRECINKRTGNRVDIICGEYKPEKFTRPDVHYLYNELQQYLYSFCNKSDEEIIKELNLQAPIIHANNYKHDLKYVYGAYKERELVLVQIYAVYKTLHLLKLLKPKLIFMTGGATINRTVAFSVANYLKIRAYRIFPAHYLNISEGYRYFFCTNNFWRLSDDPSEQFSYQSDITKRYVYDYLASIKNDNYQLDKVARTKGYALQKGLRPFPLEKRYAYNYALNANIVSEPSALPKPFFLFPLNVPIDSQLLIRAPQFQDCLSACEQVANVLPYGHSLVIKEHPGHPGMTDHHRLKPVLQSYKNVFFIHGDVRLQSLLPNATALITVNSTAAIEAILRNIPVINLGESFYRGTGLTYDVAYLLHLQNIMTDSITYKRDPAITYQLLHNVICRLLQQTVPEPGKVVTDKNSPDVIAEGIIYKLQNSL